ERDREEDGDDVSDEELLTRHEHVVPEAGELELLHAGGEDAGRRAEEERLDRADVARDLPRPQEQHEREEWRDGRLAVEEHRARACQARSGRRRRDRRRYGLVAPTGAAAGRSSGNRWSISRRTSAIGVTS